jgi:hypothetical protein
MSSQSGRSRRTAGGGHRALAAQEGRLSGLHRWPHSLAETGRGRRRRLQARCPGPWRARRQDPRHRRGRQHRRRGPCRRGHDAAARLVEDHSGHLGLAHATRRAPVSQGRRRFRSLPGRLPRRPAQPTHHPRFPPARRRTGKDREHPARTLRHSLLLARRSVALTLPATLQAQRSNRKMAPSWLWLVHY